MLSAIKGLAETGRYRAIVVVPDRGALVDECARFGVESLIQRYEFWAKPRRRVLGALNRSRINIFAAIALYRRLRGRGVVAVCSNTAVAPVGAVIALLLRVPHIWHIREFVQEDVGWRYDYGECVAMGVISRLSNHVICNSQAVARKFQRLQNNVPVSVIYNGFDIQAISNESPGEKYRRCVVGAAEMGPVLLMLGSVNEHKGQDEAIQAVAILKERKCRVRLYIVGGQDKLYRQRLDAMCRTLNVSDVVSFRGFTLGTSELWSDAALSVICSRAEAFGRTAVESIVAGTPVVAAATGGIPEIIVNCHSGLLYRKGEPTDLADKIAMLLSDESLYCRIVGEGQQIVRERFGMDRYITEYLSVVDDVVSARHHSET